MKKHRYTNGIGRLVYKILANLCQAIRPNKRKLID